VSEPSLPKGSEFVRRVVLVHSWMSVPALAIVIGCLAALLRLTDLQWRWFAGFTLLYACVATPITVWVQRRIARDLMVWLYRRERPLEAFAALMRLPLRAALLVAVSWVVPVALLSVAMAARFRTWGWLETSVMMVAGVAAGVVAGILLGYRVKTHVAGVREVLVAELPDPEARAKSIFHVPLRIKLVISTTVVTLVPVVFAALLAESRTSATLEEFVVAWQASALAAQERAVAVGEEGAAGAATPQPLLLEFDDLDALQAAGVISGEVSEHVRKLAASGSRVGDSAGLPARHAFAWRLRDDGTLAVALSPGFVLRGGDARTRAVFALLIAVTGVCAFAIARQAARDISRSTELLGSEARRLAEGDLRRGRVWESEDELGSLWRSFETMSSGLRSTVMRVSEAADRVESSASELGVVSEGVGSVAEVQVRSLDEAASSMEEIATQVRGIAASSSALNESVEESSSSILELGASGSELNETAVRLHESVEEVSSSIVQLVRSLSQVLENTESLTGAAEETSASMEEMASSLREVDVSAGETSRLSAQVVERAESGRERVRETIEGMEAIQSATETAERVIRGLHGRTVEIGAIVDVIDDVADETNLLALNAAIIAAQAGEHGRAFGVVADEIKDLAERVLASTKEIGGLISAVQEEATRATSAIEAGTSRVAQGVERSAEAGLALESITRASRESGERMAGIVVAVQAQAKASGHVVELMERVRGGVEEIRRATQEQERSHEVVSSSSVLMREVAQQVRGTTEEQARGSGRIRESIEGVRQAVEQINAALQEQSQACASALRGLERVKERTRANEEASGTLDAVTRALRTHADGLRQEVARFRVG
jgi:methyl-accepting chemotaxis protein